MTKSKIAILLCLFIINTIAAQNQPAADSLKTIISLQKQDTTEVNALVYLSRQQTQVDSAFKYVQQGLLLAQKINYKKGEADCYLQIAAINSNFLNDYSTSIKNLYDALKIYRDINYTTGIAETHLHLQGWYRDIGDYENALMHAFAGQEIAEANNTSGRAFSFGGHRLSPLFYAEIAQTYILMNQLDSAEFYIQKSIDQNELFKGSKWNFPIYMLGTIQNQKGDYKQALATFRSAIPLAIQNEFYQDTLQIYSGMSTLYKNTKELDSAIYYAKMVNESSNPEREASYWLNAINNIAQSYKLKGNIDSVLKYTEYFHQVKDSIFSRDKDRAVQNIGFNEKLKQQEIISAQAKYKSRLQLYVLFAGLLVLLLIIGILWYNTLEKQKAKSKIEKAYTELKSTQSQLIQSEKMASLGELTAGIAHEIQNPLNFVNNFSEVNRELLVELNEEIQKGNFDEVKALAKDLTENEEKIIFHGKRADAIVKGMLQHSRSSSGVKEPTDINALADEYLRLAYHGLRAKDKSFNAIMKTDFDETIGKINIIPQDIGRVILNLITNAFYACTERSRSATNEKSSSTKASGDTKYEPTVSVSTKKVGNKVEIKVLDNGNGIPKKVLDKIFQPFFTTKPTGQGTGLGLSLSYDIVKAHGGELKVETNEGKGTTFSIQLPTL
jgi:signal transduction histidine kinase/lipopolysaccharide biosynthesis regulator YciM